MSTDYQYALRHAHDPRNASTSPTRSSARRSIAYRRDDEEYQRSRGGRQAKVFHVGATMDSCMDYGGPGASLTTGLAGEGLRWATSAARCPSRRRLISTRRHRPQHDAHGAVLVLFLSALGASKGSSAAPASSPIVHLEEAMVDMGQANWQVDIDDVERARAGMTSPRRPWPAS